MEKELNTVDTKEKRKVSFDLKESETLFSTLATQNANDEITQATVAPFHNLEEEVYRQFVDEQNEVCIGKFLYQLRLAGILYKTDNRLSVLRRKLRAIQRDDSFYYFDLKLKKEKFYDLITDDIIIICRVMQKELAIPDFENFVKSIDTIYDSCSELKNGHIPEHLYRSRRPDSYFNDIWEVAICTVDGQRYSRTSLKGLTFTGHAISFVLNYALALDEYGEDEVHKYIGQEPSGHTSNDLVLDYDNRPHNPFVKAGGIALASLLGREHRSIGARFDHALSHYQLLAGNEYVGFHNPSYLTIRSDSDRSFALGHYMRENKSFPPGTSLEETLEVYFQLLSTEFTVNSLATIAGSLANGGICPTTGAQVLKPSSVRNVLSLMYSCGMYDFSGNWAFYIGLPAKGSGTGVILLVIPNVMGVVLHSPLCDLNRRGNSIRGVKFCQELVRQYGFHNFENENRVRENIYSTSGKAGPRNLRIITILICASKNDISALLGFYLKGFDLSEPDYDGRTALHLAACEGHLESVKFLTKKCNVPHSPRDRWNRTPLDDARDFKHTRVEQFLHSINAKSSETPMIPTNGQFKFLDETSDSGIYCAGVEHGAVTSPKLRHYMSDTTSESSITHIEQMSDESLTGSLVGEQSSWKVL